MDLKSKTERLDARKESDIARAAEILRQGGTVAFPTETVYGLGADALNPEAVAKIFAAKQRPSWDPLIVHVCDRAMLERVCAVPADAQRLIDRFWPGPLTLLLPRTIAIPDAVTAGRPLVGVRMPDSAIALDLIRQAGVPIAAPSANTFGHTSPTTSQHVLADLDGRIDAVLDGGPTDVGLESTVIGPYSDPDEFFNHGFVIYRPGAITLGMLESEIGTGAVHPHQPVLSAEPPDALPSPGVGLRHYAPHARLILVDEERDKLARSGQTPENVLVDAIDRAFDGSETVGVLLPDGWNPSCAQLIFRWGPWDRPRILAQRLFSGLRDLDDRGATIIICPLPEKHEISAAIRDRLLKAAR